MTEIGELIAARRLPQLESVNDETNEENGLRIAIELKPGADAEAVMAYLYKHTSLEQNFSYNATCLVPGENGQTVPRVLSLKELLQYFWTFGSSRCSVVCSISLSSCGVAFTYLRVLRSSLTGWTGP